MGENKTISGQAFILFVSLLFILLINISIVSALTLKSSNAPSSVFLGDSFQIQCDYGWALPCITGIHDNKDCSFAGFSGSNAIYNCVARTLGVKDNYCNTFSYSLFSQCIPQSNKIASTNVLLREFSLVFSSAPASVKVGDNFQIKCDYGAALPCVTATHSGVGCGFAGFSGNSAVFNCNGKTAGVQDNYCNTFIYLNDKRCNKANHDKIQSTNVVSQVCNPNWQCSSWNSCISGQQTRTCTDLNNCGTNNGKPAVSQSCCTPSCSGKQCGDNGCGGSCGSCSSGQTCNANGQCAVMSDFVSVNGNDFYLNGKKFYFAGTNAYYLWYGSYSCPAPDPNVGCSKEVLDDAKAMNLTVLRVWGFSDGTSNYWGQLQPQKGAYNEPGFQKFDKMIKEAKDRNIKLIIPLVNNWNDFGGMAQYNSWCGVSNHDDFYTNACTKQAYKDYVNYVLNRVNSLTGIKYKDDPTIMAWELANEPRAESDSSGLIIDNWIEEMGNYVKSIDNKHLLSVGEEGFNSYGTNFTKNHNHANIDFISFHLLANNWGFSLQQSLDWINSHISDAKTVGKPVILEEIGVMQPQRDSYFNSIYDLLESRSINGDLFWMLKDKNYPDFDSYGINYPEDNVNSRIINHATFMKGFNGPICTQNSQCGIDGFSGNTFCQSGNVFQDYITYTCNNPGTSSSSCSSSTSAQLKQTCTSGQSCSNGQCITKKLIAYYPFDGTWTDASGNGNNLLWPDCSQNLCPTGPATGRVGQAFNFNGVNQYLYLWDNPSISISSPLTLSTWIKYSYSDANAKGIVVKGNGGASKGYGLYLHNTDSSKVAAYFNIGGVWKWIYSPQSYNDNQWHYVLARYNGATLDLFVDGNIVASTPASGLVDINNEAFVIGTWHFAGFSNYFNGVIDEVKLWNYALNDSEILNEYQKGNIKCSNNLQCGTNSFIGNPTCSGNNVFQNYITYTCNNAGTLQSSCSNSTASQLKQTCTSGQSCSNGQCVTVSYSYTSLNVGNTVEKRFYANGFHFMTILTDVNGAIAIRPHPGVDVNGWGSSLYMQPFLPGATLRGTTISSITSNSSGINIVVSGIVSQGTSASFGNWNGNFNFNYNPGLKEINGDGKYNIYVSSTGSEINLYKLASNYLVNVPLLNGSTGDTGDMKYADITGSPWQLTWVPKSGSTFPQENRNPIIIEAVGDYNQVDTAKQGYQPIAAAYKPSMKVGLTSSRPTEYIIFGGIYDSSKSQQYWADNVGITPLVKTSSPYTSYNFDVTFNSKAIPGDH